MLGRWSICGYECGVSSLCGIARSGACIYSIDMAVGVATVVERNAVETKAQHIIFKKDSMLTVILDSTCLSTASFFKPWIVGRCAG